MWDHATGRSKGFGFVALRSKEEAQAAIDRMHGQMVGSRCVRCGWAQHKPDDTVGLVNPEEIDQ
jgi:nucleolysin TIA-1/TIAR